MSSTSASIESLLALEGWARALARDLVRDTHGAEDLVQRTYLAAIRRPPAAGVPLERWLAGVMRKLLRYEVRSRTARFARERAHARAETNELAADHALRVREAAEGLRAAVEELEEPYRSRITERYFEELEPREIARRWNMTVGTVTSQLTRARNQLRDRLDRRSGGDRESWVLGLVPLLRPQRSPQALGVAAKAALCLPLVALPLVLLWTWIATSPATQPALAAQLGPVTRLAALAPGQTGSAEESRRQPAQLAARGIELRCVDGQTLLPAAGASVTVWALPTAHTERRRLLDALRGGLDLAEHGTQLAALECDESGACQLESDPNGLLAIASLGSLWGSLKIDAKASGPISLPLHRDGSVAVRLVDDSGCPLPDVYFQLAAFGYCEWQAEPDNPCATTGLDGVARLSHVRSWMKRPDSVCNPFADLHVSAAAVGAYPIEIDPDDLPDEPIDVRLEGPLGEVEVHVLGLGPRLMSETFGVHVSWGMEPDVQYGEFYLPLVDDRIRFPAQVGTSLVVTISSPSGRSAQLETEGPRVPGALVLVPLLAGSCISGRLVDERGDPLSKTDVEFWFDDQNYWDNRVVATGPDGKFVLDGTYDVPLALRTIHFRQLGPSGVARSATAALPSGPASADLGDVRMVPQPLVASGVVVDSLGRPIANARVLGLAAPETHPDLQVDGRTDSEGEFCLRHPNAGQMPIRLVASHEGFGSTSGQYFVGQANLRFILPRGHTVRGRILLHSSMRDEPLLVAVAPTGTPHPGFIPGDTYSDRNRLSDFGVRVASLDPDGSFLVDSLPPGPYTVWLIRHPVSYAFDSGGSAPYTIYEASRVLPVDRGEGPDSVEIDLTSLFRRVLITVQDTGGYPISTARVAVQSLEGCSPGWGDSWWLDDACLSDLEGQGRVLAAAQCTALRVAAEGFYTQSFDCGLQDRVVVLERVRPREYRLQTAPSTLPEGFALSIISTGVDAGAFATGRWPHKCWREGACGAFDADGILRCTGPVLGAVDLRFVLYDENQRGSEAYVEVEVAPIPEVLGLDGPLVVELPTPDQRAIQSAVAALRTKIRGE